MPRLRARVVLLAVVAMVLAAGCGSPSGNKGGGSGSSGGGDANGTGPFSYVTGKDTSGTLQKQLDKWNALHPDMKAKAIELPEDADAQRQQMVTNLQAKSSSYDVLNMDVVWTAEFAKSGWIVPLTESDFPVDKYLKPVVDSAKFEGKLYAAPYTSDGGMLYYRTDLLKNAGIEKPPATWGEMTDDCKKVQAQTKIDCYAGQFFKYEGLTVNFSEAVQSAGGEIITDNGTKVALGQQAVQGLSFLANGFKQGYIPKDAITYKEEEGRRAFQQGKLLFMRNWPYVYSLASKAGPDSKIAGKFAVAPLPGLNGPGSSSLGGHNEAISAYSKHQKSAREFLKWFTSHDAERTNLQANSLAPAYIDLYDDPELVKQYPYLPILKQSILSAKPRPITPNYQEVTVAIENAAYAALQGGTSPESAISDLTKKLNDIIQNG